MWKSLLSQNVGHNKPAVAPNKQTDKKKKRNGRAAAIILMTLVTMAGVANSKALGIKKCEKKFCNQKRIFVTKIL